MTGPLTGLRVIEIAGLGPAPFCAMLFADMGAQVLRIDRPGGGAKITKEEVTARGRPTIELDLRQDEQRNRLLKLVDTADVLIEGFRPGVMERLGVGPEVCHARRPELVYGRMTGWGQSGPLSKAAGHDINYIAITGALYGIGSPGEPPAVPLNLVGDYGGGAMLLAFGVLSAVFEARRSGKGQVVDAAMSDGTALLLSMYYGFRAAGIWTDGRGENMLDGGAHYYGSYECSDGKFIAIGAIEPQFYALLMEKCGINEPDMLSRQQDKSRWPEFKGQLAALFKNRTRDEWCRTLEGTDACFAPVLDWAEAPRYAHNVERHTFVDVDGVIQPAPAPRFSRTPGVAGRVRIGDDPRDVLREWEGGNSWL
ncbi:CaiB/BaiF CoA-transferase family protein [Rhizobium leguminosarum]|uniref:CaiB/BaiF CoA transferase family protein n=1 Tax=Rhizobium leguminosarum TaxID=384 RepID=UPI0024A7E442|nr:CaiB/BaiF CoA-transferase family protein [Rhizobium leguminosarum]MDI5929671.1 CaiB/BaiF CoA-transferase family protein [Rhizobium leguminosarum]